MLLPMEVEGNAEVHDIMEENWVFEGTAPKLF